MKDLTIACWFGMHVECAELQTRPDSIFRACQCRCHLFQKKDRAKIGKEST